MQIIKITLATLLAYLLAFAVVLSCLHAKDLAAYRAATAHVPIVGDSHATDLVAKAIGELHTHVDKTALKNIAKSFGDQTVLAYDRQLQQLRQRYPRTASTVLMEALLLFRIAAASLRFA